MPLDRHVGFSLKLIVALLIGLIAASLLFAAWPSLDLAASGLFFDGSTFPVASIHPVEWLRVAMFVAEDAGFVAALGLSLYTWQKGRVLRLSTRDWVFQTLIFVLGPGLIVNRILKRFWGRARPFQITPFGGDRTFSPAWKMTDQCAANCSFVSGEMAGATALAICLVFILRANCSAMPSRHYYAGVALALAIPLLTAWQRMAVGRHFLSDVVIAALLVGLLAAGLRQALYGRQPG